MRFAEIGENLPEAHVSLSCLAVLNPGIMSMPRTMSSVSVRSTECNRGHKKTPQCPPCVPPPALRTSSQGTDKRHTTPRPNSCLMPPYLKDDPKGGNMVVWEDL